MGRATRNGPPGPPGGSGTGEPEREGSATPDDGPPRREARGAAAEGVPVAGDPRLTERRNPRTRRIDRMGAEEVVRLLLAEERRVPAAVEAEAGRIAELIERVAGRMRCGGRLFYVGAGTSGRLGALDAAECPPTFGTNPELVQSIVAGGPEALLRSREGAEDDEEGGRLAVRRAGVGERDFVLGIATSGTTPFVRAALEEAAARGAEVGFLSCTPPPEDVARLARVRVTPLVGPEAIAGSTRLKAGTATKLVLNALTTGTMVRLGKVYESLMVDLRATSLKLADRSERILREVCAVEAGEARRLLAAAGGSAKTAIAMRRLGVDRARAERLLDACDGFLGEALERFADSPRPYYACYPASASPAEASGLAERLAGAPETLAGALEESERRDAEGGGSLVRAPGRWGPSQHIAHLLEFETGAVRPRVAAWATGPEDAPPSDFPDFAPSEDPPAGERPREDLLELFREERARTVELLPSPASAAWSRRARVGGEEATLHQFLRGVAQHDGAHALRIRERVHVSLLGAAGGAMTGGWRAGRDGG